MYRIVDGNTAGLADVEEFVTTLQTIERHPAAEARDLFTSASEVIVSRAPGRLDVMGGIADYSGSLVLQMPIREATLVALAQSEKREIRIVSLGSEAAGRPVRSFNEIGFAELEKDGHGRLTTAEARALFQHRDAQNRWSSLCCGRISLVLMREKGAFVLRRGRAY